MDRHAKLNDQAAAAIAELIRDGIAPTPAEIVLLNALGHAVETGATRRLLARGTPVRIGAAWLWPLTMYASDWFARVGLAMPESLQARALAYAMAHGYGNELDADGREAERAVKTWARSLRCTTGELTEAVSQIIEQDEEAPSEPDTKDNEDARQGMSVGELSAFLTAACGGPPDVWEKGLALGYALSLVRAIVQQNGADGRPSANDPRMKAERAFALAAIEIKESRRGQ